VRARAAQRVSLNSILYSKRISEARIDKEIDKVLAHRGPTIVVDSCATCSCGKPVYADGKCTGCDEIAFYARQAARGESME
jgi:hypothetical protein